MIRWKTIALALYKKWVISSGTFNVGQPHPFCHVLLLTHPNLYDYIYTIWVYDVSKQLSLQTIFSRSVVLRSYPNILVCWEWCRSVEKISVLELGGGSFHLEMAVLVSLTVQTWSVLSKSKRRPRPLLMGLNGWSVVWKPRCTVSLDLRLREKGFRFPDLYLISHSDAFISWHLSRVGEMVQGRQTILHSLVMFIGTNPGLYIILYILGEWHKCNCPELW